MRYSIRNSKGRRFEGFAFGAAFGTLLALLASCNGEGKVIGTFSLENPERSFIREGPGVRFVDWEGEKPKMRSITTNLSHKGKGGSRPAFAGKGDFTLEITLKDIPPRSVFSTAFGIPIKDAYFQKALSARYEITLNGRSVVEKTIDSFKEPQNQTWYEEKVDLAGLEGAVAKIRLKATRSPPGVEVQRGWAEPCVLVTRNLPWREAGSQRPNIILVMVDTLRADHLGCYGYGRDTSPNLDAFAARSLLFENAVAPSSWTWPSIASMFTGQYPLHHGVVNGARSRLGFGKRTLAEICADAGMKTAAFVANPLISPSKNFDRGFETFEVLSWADAGTLVDRFFRWLDQEKKGRFLAYLHFMDPHGPYSPPDDYIARFSDPKEPHRLPPDALKDLGNRLGTNKQAAEEVDPRLVQNAMDRYDSEILFWDEQFGRLVAKVESLGLAGKTLIVVTADHGEEFLEHGILGHGWTLFDISVKIPLIMKGPAIAPARIEEQVELIDLAPTLLDAAHIEGKGADFDGASLLDRGLGARPEGAFTHTAHAFSPELKHRTSLFALQTGRWKLIYDPKSERMRLFDLDKDAGELEDLAGDPAFDELCRRFRDRIKAWIKRYEGKSPSGFYELDDETLKAFEQLGYAF